jgi:putative flippase GtrA
MGLIDTSRVLARKHEEKLRFLVAGIVNTIIGYGLFAIMLFIFGTARYNIALVAAWVISVCASYTNFKLFVFKTRGTNWMTELLRSYIVYTGTLAVNLVVLNVFVKLVHLHPLVAQFASIFIVTMISYLGHKYFTFRHVVEGVDEGGVFEEAAPVSAEEPFEER